MDSAPTRIGYVTSRYPLITHTFIQREVAGLRELGHDVTTFTVRASSPDELLTPADRAEAQATIAIFPPSPRAVGRGLLGPLLRHPGAVVGLVRHAAHKRWAQPVALLWRLFYVAEALLLWRACRDRGIRHLHAHHANVAADLAWLATEFARRVDPEASASWSFTLHGPLELMAVSDHDLTRKAASAGAVACISDFTRSQLMMHSDPDHWDRFRVVRCSVDSQSFVPASRRRTDPASPFTVLGIGRITAQ